MKTVFLAIFAILYSATVQADTLSNYSKRMDYTDPNATKTLKVPSKSQRRLDYTGTTSGYPIYSGFAAKGVATTDELWRVCKATDTSDGPTLIQCAEDVAWDDRAAATYS